MLPLRPRNVLPLAAVALLAAGCTGTTPAAHQSPARSTRPAGLHSGSSGSSDSSGQPRSAPSSTSASGSPTPTPSPAAAQPCPASQLDVSLSSGGAAAGSSYTRLVFTNTGASQCTLTGFPGVSLVQHQGGAPIGAPADRLGPSRSVTLAPGASARSALQIVDAQNFPTDRCGQTPAKGVVVYPPNETASVFLPDDLLGCADQSVQILHVQAVRAAS